MAFTNNERLDTLRRSFRGWIVLDTLTGTYHEVDFDFIVIMRDKDCSGLRLQGLEPQQLTEEMKLHNAMTQQRNRYVPKIERMERVA